MPFQVYFRSRLDNFLRIFQLKRVYKCFPDRYSGFGTENFIFWHELGKIRIIIYPVVILIAKLVKTLTSIKSIGKLPKLR